MTPAPASNWIIVGCQDAFSAAWVKVDSFGRNSPHEYSHTIEKEWRFEYQHL